MALPAKKLPAIELIKDRVVHIPLTLIVDDPEQPRADFDDAGLKDLADDIKVNGVQQPVTLRPHPKDKGIFMVVLGGRRTRASRLAKKDTIPSLLWVGAKGKKAELHRLLSQVKENHLRKDLNPMEWSDLFYDMIKVHGLKQNEIEKILKDNKVGTFSRGHIANLLGLRKLPDWITDRIRSGELKAAHGKRLIPAMDSNNVMDAIQKKFKPEYDGFESWSAGDDGWQPTEAELHQEIYWTFLREHTDLYKWDTDFDVDQKCKGCKKKKKITGPGGSNNKATICMDRKCWGTFQAEFAQEVEAKRKAARAKHDGAGSLDNTGSVPALKFDAKKRVDPEQQEIFPDFEDLEHVDFNKAACKKCEHKRVIFNKEDYDFEVEEVEEGEVINEKDFELDGCFNPDCYNEKECQADRANNAVKKIAADAVAVKLKNFPMLASKLLVWAAAERPTGVELTGETEHVVFDQIRILPQNLGRGNEAIENVLFQRQLLSLSQFLLADEIAFIPLAEIITRTLSNDALRDLLKHFKIDITDFQVDEAYIASLSSEDIDELIKTATLPRGLPIALQNDLDTKLEKWKSKKGPTKIIIQEKTEDLRDFMLRNIASFKAPAKDIQYAWQQLMSEETDA